MTSTPTGRVPFIQYPSLKAFRAAVATAFYVDPCGEPLAIATIRTDHDIELRAGVTVATQDVILADLHAAYDCKRDHAAVSGTVVVVTPDDFVWPAGITVDRLPHGHWVAYRGRPGHRCAPDCCRYSARSLAAVHDMITAATRGTHG